MAGNHFLLLQFKKIEKNAAKYKYVWPIFIDILVTHRDGTSKKISATQGLLASTAVIFS